MLVFIFSSDHLNHDNSDGGRQKLRPYQAFESFDLLLVTGPGSQKIYKSSLDSHLYIVQKSFPSISAVNLEILCLLEEPDTLHPDMCRFMFYFNENQKPKDYNSVKKPSRCWFN